MKLSKWGNSLAIRVPAEIVDLLHLKEGDPIEVGIAGRQSFNIRRDPAMQKALAQIQRLRRPLPAGFKFDREEAHQRGSKTAK